VPLRRHALATLVAVCLTLGITPAFAGKPQSTPLPAPTGPTIGSPTGSVSGTTTECNLGVVGPAAVAYGYVLPSNDEYYTLINPATCSDCQADSRLLLWARMELNFIAPCEIPVTISIVPAVEIGDGCFVPNRSAPAICEPVEYRVSDDGVTGQCVDYAWPVPAGCFIDGPAFLKIEFDEGSCLNGNPQFCGLTTCNHCTQYNFYPVDARDDLCVVFPGDLKSIIMYVESASCQPTSTAPGSWGRLKTLYR